MLSQTQKVETDPQALDDNHPNRQVFQGTHVPIDVISELVNFLKARSDKFALSLDDRTDIDPEILNHKLKVNPL